MPQFILAIEPLIRNINMDDSILGLNIEGNNIPKALAYADDVSCIIVPNQHNLQKIFSHYQVMSELSGLNLNADKTEIISRGDESNLYNLNYNQDTVTVKTGEDVKINGIYLSFDVNKVRERNFNKIYSSVEKQLRMWSSRGLSLMGKIQIYKTFGLSQILFACSTIMLTKKEDMQLSNLIFKFIWNRNMDSKKAPDRIKRSILNLKVKDLGFGMIDFRDVITSIRVKNVTRLLNNPDHPMNKIIRNSINSSIINIKCLNKVRPTIDEAIDKIRNMWLTAIKKCIHEGVAPKILVDIALNEYVGNITYHRFRNKRLVLTHRHDRLFEINNLSRDHPIFKKIDKNIQGLLSLNTTYLDNYVPSSFENNYSILPIIDKFKPTAVVTSREIRTTFQSVTSKSCKMITEPNEDCLTNLGHTIAKLTNVRSKTTLLRTIHGDIYCGTRMKKFGMIDSDLCSRCGFPETIAHQIMECSYVTKIWEIVSNLTGIKIKNLNQILGHDPTHDKITLTLHAEIIRQLLAITRPTTDPINVVLSSVRRLAIVEKGITKFQINNMLKELTAIT